MGEFVTIRYSCTFPFPVPQAYEWLTDFREDDPQRTQAIQEKRTLVEQGPGYFIGDVTINTLGRRGTGRVEVRTYPPDRWEAKWLSGWGKGNHYTYQVAPTPDGGTRLDVVYNFRVKRLRHRILFWLARAKLRREIHTMWEGFRESMIQELGARPTAVSG